MIYFIGAYNDDNVCEAIKIGHTYCSIGIRQSNLQTGNHRRLKLLGTAEGHGPWIEKQIHNDLKNLSLHIRGDWFRNHEVVRCVLMEVCHTIKCREI